MIALLKNNRVEIHPENLKEAISLEEIINEGHFYVDYRYDKDNLIDRVIIEKTEE